MAIKFELSARNRLVKGKEAAKKLRRQGITPAIIYGSRKENLPICFNTNEFLKLVHGELHENMIFEINLEGDNGNKKPNVIIKEIQTNPVNGTLLHVDFYEISMEQMIEVHVPVEIIGEAVGVKDEGGLLDHISREILIECLPEYLPENIQIDVSALRLGDSLHIKDITFPPGVKHIENPDKVILTIIHKLKGRVEEVLITEEEEEPEVLTQKSSGKEEKE